jgi:hypothetical protein
MEVILPVYGRAWQVFHAADGGPNHPDFHNWKGGDGKIPKKGHLYPKGPH